MVDASPEIHQKIVSSWTNYPGVKKALSNIKTLNDNIRSQKINSTLIEKVRSAAIIINTSKFIEAYKNYKFTK